MRPCRVEKDYLLTLAAATPTVTYAGNDAVGSFSFPFPVFQQSDLEVIIVGATKATLTLGTDYTVSGLSPGGSPALTTGVVTLIATGQPWLTGSNLATGYSLVIQRQMLVQQLTSLRNQGPYYPETIEDALDYITMLLQQQSVGSFILQDTVNGNFYQLIMVDGILSQVQVG